MDEQQCSICLQNLNIGNLIKTNCGHFFHHTCLASWINNQNRNTCPICRSVILLENVNNNESDIICDNIITSFVNFCNNITFSNFHSFHSNLLNIYNITECIIRNYPRDNYFLFRYNIMFILKFMFILFFENDWIAQLVILGIFSFQLLTLKILLPNIKILFYIINIIPFFINYIWAIYIGINLSLDSNIFSNKLRKIIYYIDIIIFNIDCLNLVYILLTDKIFKKIYTKIIGRFNI